MGKVITVYAPKGGVAKTTTVLGVASCLARLGYRVLIVDTDPQANATAGICDKTIDKTIKDLLQKNVIDSIKKGKPPMDLYDEVIYDTTEPHLKIMASCLALSVTEEEISTRMSRERVLKKALEPIKNDYDFTLVDTKPSIGWLPFNALCAAEEAIVPAYDPYSVSAVQQMIETVLQLKQELDADVKISGILSTRYNRSTTLSKAVRDELIKQYGTGVFRTIIYQDIKLSKCAIQHQSIFSYDPNSSGAKSYKAFTKELLTGWGMI